MRTLSLLGSLLTLGPPRAPEAIRRVHAARTLLLNPIHQQNLAARLIKVGLQPVTRHLDCPINVEAVEKYIRDAGPAADAPAMMAVARSVSVHANFYKVLMVSPLYAWHTGTPF